ncbi:hypothetical protein [Streptomyces sp. NPDC001108]
MTSNQTTSFPRILTDEEYDRAYDALRDNGQRLGYQISHTATAEMVFHVLASVGVFLPAPTPDTDTCTALYLPHDPDEYGAELLGEWQQCEDEPGHEGTFHESGNTGWPEGAAGSVPARTADEKTS